MRGPRGISASQHLRPRPPGAMRGPLLSTLLLAALRQLRHPGGCGALSPRGLRGPHLLRSEIKKEEKMGKWRGAFLVEIPPDE